jgi:hypothetical protein
MAYALNESRHEPFGSEWELSITVGFLYLLGLLNSKKVIPYGTAVGSRAIIYLSGCPLLEYTFVKAFTVPIKSLFF